MSKGGRPLEGKEAIMVRIRLPLFLTGLFAIHAGPVIPESLATVLASKTLEAPGQLQEDERSANDVQLLRARLLATPKDTVVIVTLRDGERIEGPLAKVTETTFGVMVDADEETRRRLNLPSGTKISRQLTFDQVIDLEGTHWPPPEGPVNVYMHSTQVQSLEKSERKALEKAHKQKVSERDKARKNLEKQLKKQFGKKHQSWPAESQEEYRRAEEAVTIARFELENLRSGAASRHGQQSIDDAREDIEKFAGEKELIRLVHTREEAHLVVEVLDRRMGKATSGQGVVLAVLGQEYIVAIRVSPGDALRSNQLSKFQFASQIGRRIVTVHAFRQDEPYWIIECVGEGRWQNSGYTAAGMLQAFIEDYGWVLTRDASPR
jgi:hypothetical protein